MLKELLDAVRHCSPPLLREKARLLKQEDGESWAIGELVERACIMLDTLAYATGEYKEADVSQ